MGAAGDCPAAFFASPASILYFLQKVAERRIHNVVLAIDKCNITQPWKCADRRWFLPHFNLPHLEKAGRPKLTPVYACDFLTGFMGAFGAMVALRRRALEGGSYVVRVSLCQSAMLLQREGLVTGFENAPGKLDPQTFESLAVCDDGTIYGDLKTPGPVIRMSETNPRWNGTTPELGSSEAAWW